MSTFASFVAVLSPLTLALDLGLKQLNIGGLSDSRKSVCDSDLEFGTLGGYNRRSTV